MGASLVVVWADPGVTTGWAVVKVPVEALLARGQVGSVSEMRYRVGQFRSEGTSEAVSSYLNLARAAWERLADEEDLFVIGCEGFILRMQSTDPALLEPVRFLAVLRDRLRESGQGVEVQMPSEMKNVITEQRMRLWGLWEGGVQHGRDAFGHALLFLRRFASQEEVRKRVGWEE